MGLRLGTCICDIMKSKLWLPLLYSFHTNIVRIRIRSSNGLDGFVKKLTKPGDASKVCFHWTFIDGPLVVVARYFNIQNCH